MHDSDTLDDFELEPEEIEAYCVRCKLKTVMSNPKAVWTKRGAPGTRGECEICGTTVFRMGRTEAHQGMVQPDISQFSDISGTGRKGLPRYATFVNFSKADIDLAERIATDLARTGIPTWFEEDEPAEDVEWASGTHPALEECTNMVLVLSKESVNASNVTNNWQYFREQKKPIVIALAEPCEVPDEIRRRPRFDFSADYKTAFRELVQTLAS